MRKDPISYFKSNFNVKHNTRAEAIDLAFRSAKNGYRVFFVMLHEEDGAIEMWLAYKVFASCFFADPFRERRHISFADFYFGRLDNLVDTYQTQIRVEFQRASSLITTYPRGHYNVENLVAQLDSIKAVDLLFVDVKRELFPENFCCSKLAQIAESKKIQIQLVQ